MPTFQWMGEFAEKNCLQEAIERIMEAYEREDVEHGRGELLHWIRVSNIFEQTGLDVAE